MYFGIARTKTIYTIAAVAALALLATASLWLFRFDVVLSPDGASVSRNRFTGEVVICNAFNECRSRIAQAIEPSVDPLFKKAVDLAGAQIDRELRIGVWSAAELANHDAKIAKLERELKELGFPSSR